MQAAQAYPHGALAYYNCGPLSGASQPHKHVQVVPLPLHSDSPRAVPMSAAIEPALDGSQGSGAVVAVTSLPFQAYACRIPEGCEPAHTFVSASGLGAPPVRVS